jgi:hypothetical protein
MWTAMALLALLHLKDVLMAGKNLGVTATCTDRNRRIGIWQTVIASWKEAIWLQSNPKQSMILFLTWYHQILQHQLGLEHQTWQKR